MKHFLSSLKKHAQYTVSWWCCLTIFHCPQKLQKIWYFSYWWESETCLLSIMNECKIMLTLKCFDIWGCAFPCLSKKFKFSKFYLYKIGKSETMTSLTHSFAYMHIDCLRNVSWKLAKTSSLLLIRFSIKFSLFCLKKKNLYIELI